MNQSTSMNGLNFSFLAVENISLCSGLKYISVIGALSPQKWPMVANCPLQERLKFYRNKV